jgi:hypothetical protein
MTKRTIITEKDLDVFSALVGEISERSAALAQTSVAAAAIVDHNAAHGNIDGALAFGVSSIEALTSELDTMLRRFEAMARKVTGEARRPAETIHEYFQRICSTDPLAAMIRNGRVLKM